MDKCINESNLISFDCSYHKGSKPQLLYLNKNDQQSQGDIILCNKCFNQKKYKQQHFDNYLFIDDLLYSNEKTILSKWPPLANQDLLFDINSILEDDSKCVNRQNEVVLDYFDSLKQEINEHIDQVRKQMLIQCNKIPELEDQFMKRYNQIAEKDRIRELLITRYPDNSQVQGKISEMFELKKKQKEENEDILLSVYTPYFKQLSSFDQSNPKRLKESIITMIHSIDFFPDLGDKKENWSNIDGKLMQVYENMKKKQEDIQLSPSQKFLLELINSPSNYLTKEFSEQLAETMKQLTPFFSNIDISNCTRQNKAPIKFNRLKMEQVELIDKLVNKMKEVEYSDIFQNAIIQSLPNTSAALSLLDRESEDFGQLILLLQQYPILEFMKRDFNFVKSAFLNTKTNLDMERINDGSINFTKKNVDGWYNIILSNQYLKKQKTYKIIFNLIPLNLNRYTFCIGLTSKGQTQLLYSDKLSLCITHKGIENANGMDKLKKGDKNNFKDHKDFELTVNLSKGVFQIADQLTCTDIIEIEDDKKQELMSDSLYQIGFTIYYQGDILSVDNIQEINE